MRYLRVCHGDMEKGQLRVDANVSLRRSGEPLGTRVEIKNINSFRFLHQALVYEIQRQTDSLASGTPIVQETRGFDPSKGVTYSMRSKEHDYDYWYFPDPDLLPLAMSDQEVQDLKGDLPELPWVKCQRFQTEYGLSAYDAALLTDEWETAAFFEEVVASRQCSDFYKSAANWVLGEVFSYLNQEKKSLAQCPITPAHLRELLDHLANKTLSHPLAKEVFCPYVDHGPRSFYPYEGKEPGTGNRHPPNPSVDTRCFAERMCSSPTVSRRQNQGVRIPGGASDERVQR